jgi:hypothetical protein
MHRLLLFNINTKYTCREHLCHPGMKNEYPKLHNEGVSAGNEIKKYFTNKYERQPKNTLSVYT